jgi:flavin-binding protein dodecin
LTRRIQRPGAAQKWRCLLTARRQQEDEIMAVARVSKITAASTQGFQEATEEGMKRAMKTLRGVTGFEILSQKVKVEDDKIAEYRVTMEVTFILE